MTYSFLLLFTSFAVFRYVRGFKLSNFHFLYSFNFRAFTAGIVDGKAKAYTFISHGLALFCSGLNVYRYLPLMGDDPHCVLSWRMEAKSYFFKPLVFFLNLACVILVTAAVNVHGNRLRKATQASLSRQDEFAQCFGY